MKITIAPPPGAMSKSKKEAAEFLGVSVRSIESYASAGKLTVSYARGARGQVAQFDDAELETLKAELSQPVYPTRPAIQKTNTEIATIPPQGSFGPFDPLQIIDRLAQIYHSRIRLNEKLTLSLPEAAELSGLSQNRLRTDTKLGKLKSIEGGRGYRITRADLDAYIASL